MWLHYICKQTKTLIIFFNFNTFKLIFLSVCLISNHKKSSIFYFKNSRSVQILFYLFAFVQQSFQFNDSFHVHFVDFHQGIFVIFENDWLVFFFWVDSIFYAWSISFVLFLSLILKIFDISCKFNKPTGWFWESWWEWILKLLKLFFKIFLTHYWGK